MGSSLSAMPGKQRRIPDGIAPSCAEFGWPGFWPAPGDPSMDQPDGALLLGADPRLCP
ncbi:MAG: hypothetical protein RLZZ458_1185 [Planctomycetota bacterium]|jgi:hypothetical protein